jgi:hypothetical protein
MTSGSTRRFSASICGVGAVEVELQQARNSYGVLENFGFDLE